MDREKLCLVIPSLQAGGMERVMSELASYFAKKQDTEVHLVLYGITREIFYNIPENIWIHKPVFQFNNHQRLISTLRTLAFLRKTISQLRPVSVLSFGEYWNSFVLIALFCLKYPVFVSDRSQPDKSLGWLHNTLRKYLYPRAKGVICQTQRAKNIYLSEYKHSNMVVIGNPVRMIQSSAPMSHRKKNVLMVGRLIKTKHQDKLIEMFSRVSSSEWNLMIVGYDHLKQHNLEKLKELADELGVRERVLFPGRQENVDVIYSESSIFAFTSSSEGFPNAIAEAMSAGLPVVAFDCVAGPSELITDGYNGFLVPLFDYKQFEEKLTKLMSDERLREELGTNARRSVQRYTKEKICDEYYKFIMQYPDSISSNLNYS